MGGSPLPLENESYSGALALHLRFAAQRGARRRALQGARSGSRVPFFLVGVKALPPRGFFPHQTAFPLQGHGAALRASLAHHR